MALFDRILHFFGVPTHKEREARRLSVKLDASLFHSLCRTLRAEAPQGSSLLIMDARLPESGEGCELNCRVEKSGGKHTRFTPSAEASQQLCGCLHQLRHSMVVQRQPRWKGIKLIVDVSADKYHAEFRYS